MKISMISQAFAGAGSGTAETTAKASPGIAVSGLYLAGVDINTWVSVLTALYLMFMIVKAAPGACEGLRYLWRLAHGETSALPPVKTVDVTEETVGAKLKGGTDENVG